MLPHAEGLRFSGSLRLRLAAWHGLVLLGTMASLAAVLYVVAQTELIRHHDQALVRSARAVAAVIAEHEDCAHLTTDQTSRLDAIGGLILVHDVQGENRVFYRSEESARFELPAQLLDGGALQRREPWFEALPTGHGLVRVFSLPYTSNAGRVGLIRIMEPLGDVEQPLHALRAAMLLMAPVSLVVAFAGGLWLSGRALRPVDRITALARHIEAHDLSQRLPALGSRDELGRLVETLNQMIARLEASFQGMRRFTADASHEMRTPLATIVATIDVVLAKERSADAYVRSLRSIAEEVERLRVIVDDLLLLARADAGVATMRAEPMRLDEIVRDVAETMAPLARECSVTLEVVTAGTSLVRGDEPWMRHLVSNLLENAVKFTAAAGHEEGKSVHVGLRNEGDEAVLEVEDRGPGIPEADLSRIFDRFYRSQGTRSRVDGAGLGLAISRWIAESHGGRIRAANAAGGGAVFTVRLPMLHGPGLE